MIIDNLYLEVVMNKNKENLDDIKHKYDWNQAIVQGSIDRLDTFFSKSVITHKMHLFTLRGEEYVTSLRCPSLPENYEDDLAELESSIDDFRNKIDFQLLDVEYRRYIQTDNDLDLNDDEEILKTIEKVKMRIDDFKRKTDPKSIDRIDFGKDLIKDELANNDIEMANLLKFKTNRERKQQKLKAKSGAKDKTKEKVNIFFTIIIILVS